jgi:hypothetical protein
MMGRLDGQFVGVSGGSLVHWLVGCWGQSMSWLAVGLVGVWLVHGLFGRLMVGRMLGG